MDLSEHVPSTSRFVGGVKKIGSPIFSQTRTYQRRKQQGLHPVSELSRFHILVCCFFCSLCVSLTYAFDLFTTNFRDQFGLSSGDLTIISTIGLVFCYFTIPYSFIFENLGPFLTFWMCVVAAIIGGAGLAGVFRGQIPGNTATLTVFYAFLNMASGLLDTSYVSTLVEVFPRNRGPVVCLAKVMTGLGSSVLAALSDTFFEGSIIGFIYFIMSLCIVVGVWASFTVALPPYFMNWWRRQGKSQAHIAALRRTEVYYASKSVPMPRLIIGYVVIISLVIFFAVEAPVIAYTGTVSHGARMAVGTITVVLVLCIFLMLLPLRILGGINEPAPEVVQLEERRSASEHDVDGNPVKTGGAGPVTFAEPFVEEDGEPRLDGSSTEDGEGELEEEYTYQDPRYKGTVKDYLKSPDLWLILLLFVCYGCTGIIVMYNSSTISVAISGSERSDKLSALYTAFLGVGSSVGRIAFGLFEAYVQQQDPDNRKVIVTMALPLSPLLSFLGSLFLLVLPGQAVLFPFILVYLEEGFFAGVNALIFPCLFESNHNFLYNISFLVQMCTTIAFNLGMFGRLIDREQKRLGIPMTSECNQKSCVRISLIVSAVLGFCGIFVALAIHFRYAAFVKRERARVKAARRTVAREGEEEEMEVAALEGRVA